MTSPAFVSAHQTRPTFHLVLDFHTTSSSQNARLALRDSASRFLRRLFLYPPSKTTTDLCTLFVAPITAPTCEPSLSLLVETAALRDQRNLSTSQYRLRHAVNPFHKPADADLHAKHVANAVLEWGVTNVIILSPCHRVAETIQQTIATQQVEATVVFAHSKEIANHALDEVIATAHQTTLTLTLPAHRPTSSDTAEGITSSILTLSTRPRVLTSAAPPTTLIATRQVLLHTLPCDVQTGPPRLLWGCGMQSLCTQLLGRGVGLVCVESNRLYVIVPGQNGMGLVKELGHQDSVLPIPKTEEDGVEALMGGLATDGYDAWQVGLGRAKGWGGGRVGFGGIKSV